MTVAQEQVRKYEELATIEAERRGVIAYDVRGNTMTYDANYPAERTTYRVVINLNTGKETRRARPKYYKSGSVNAYC